MIIAILFVGLVSGLVSGGVMLFLLDIGWLLSIGGFYAGAFIGMGLVMTRVIALDGKNDGVAPAPAQSRLA